MGVPAFASWLKKKYPEIASDVIPANVHGLYIDLNALIHPCCHSERDPAVAARPEEEKLLRICHEVEVLLATVRPKKIMFIATDGVAPRAKMNQQRARRYMNRAKKVSSGADVVEEVVREFTSNEMAAVDDDLDDIRRSLMQDALYGMDGFLDDTLETLNSATSTAQPATPATLCNDDNDGAMYAGELAALDGLVDRTPEVAEFDSNCISPGTAFMVKVTNAVLTMVQDKLAVADQLWAGLNVIVSGANTSGEGEHKIIDFLRTQSSYAGFNGSGTHVIAGLDADLIFLSLSLHIPHMFILRDNGRNPYALRTAERSRGKKQTLPQMSGAKNKTNAFGGSPPMEEDLEGDELPFIVDDDDDHHSRHSSEEVSKTTWAPGMPEANTTFEYFDIDTVGSCLMSELHGLCLIKQFAPNNKAAFNPELLVSSNGYHFYRQAGRADAPLRYASNEEVEKDNDKEGWRNFRPCSSQANSKVIDDVIVMAMLMGNDFLPRLPGSFCGESALDNLLEIYVTEVLPYGFITAGYHEIHLPQLRRLLQAYAKIETVKFRRFALSNNTMSLNEVAEPLHSPVDEQWRQPYLASTGLAGNVEEACKKYVEGLRFVWRYYSGTSSMCSWLWYYPFHHAPFALDIADYLQRCDLATLPAPPLETMPPDMFLQLLCILPPTSHALLPTALGNAMLNPPEKLRETFPDTWRVDYTAAFGKDHLATVLLPFANMFELRDLVEASRPCFTCEEHERGRQVTYHLVLGSKTNSFEINGDICALSADDATTWGLEREGVIYMQLWDSLPKRGRPKTYSCTAVVPWITCDAHGRVNKRERLSRRERRQRRENVLSERGVILINKGACFSTYLFGFAISALLMSMALLPWFSTSLLQVLAVNFTAVAFSYFLGIAVHNPVLGSGVRRNNVRMTYVDWLCTECLSLNFSSNDKCFVCRAPFDLTRCLAVFSGTQSATPPLYDPNHAAYMETVCLEIPGRKKDRHARCRPPTGGI
ncbi:5'-3' exonuclease XRNB, putative,exoribonuclease 2 [Trypanosoma rangeli]|uniref:5'-3' exonuclease XRNB, putative,exoribonuclease 2 n=1 Tax=Trypanosoma rangeli TaxID=5698 RepID=A0A422NS66_TRYRA|nr:5'-3' exonuclease XRNB, putative,exoribonuclease 2 [Trypanosoma rangeli]RNF08296.1 5'-3' exonuclease XRNB, putative,exoribonuclease 2 [Trypanosoma rangeli]|eukprot:RNF08296.1 5'-3' exonuclease XRNB, putative,exoribonuclease 2 [Trypanosoma rangeli]